MHYRDLIPSRLGGRYIASHIAIAEGGPVADWVHFHRIAFQLICVRKGWVRVVYEDQGEPFVMAAGDMVLQPPGIRHRVLESAPGLEVVEITCPALHETFADHEMALPNGSSDPARDYEGQRFLHHVAATTPWRRGTAPKRRRRGCATPPAGSPKRASSGPAPRRSSPCRRTTASWCSASFSKARSGSTMAKAIRSARPTLSRSRRAEAWRLAEMSGDFRLLHVTTGRIHRT